MQLATYLTYKDVKGVDISYNDSILFIKLIYKKYKREIILELLGFASKEIGLDNSLKSSHELQLKLKIDTNGLLVHNSAILVLFQVFYETTLFDDNNHSLILDSNDHTLLFLYANQILTKSTSPGGGISSNNITIGHLMTMMRMHVGLINSFDVNLSNELFVELYKKLIKSSKYLEYDKVIKENTDLSITDFISILENFFNKVKIPNMFNIYDKFAVLKYEDIYNYWNNRIPKLKIPLEYRSFEQYPIIKHKNKYYPTSILMLFLVLSRKIYHLLSSDNNARKEFRMLWGTEIVEPVIKKYLFDIFDNQDVKIIDRDAQKDLGLELTDIMMLHKGDIFLLEIKSGYMALEHRYTDDPKVFKEYFDKRYILNSSKKHQLINQLDLFHNNYDLLINYYNLDKNIKYKVYSAILVYDEALSMIGFKRYVSKLFNDILDKNLTSYTKFLPYIYSNVFTFNEIISFKRRIQDKAKRFLLFKSTFNYHDSFFELIDDIKDNKIEIIGLTKEDIN